MTSKVLVSGAQPSGELHLGNYLGALRNWTEMQANYDSLFFIVDQHAITIRQNPAELRRRTLTCAAQYIACGLDPQKCSIFIQSHVIGHAELAWVLGCMTPLGQLQRMTQFKDKQQKSENVDAGLLFYPVLMAADILLYNTELVPVGEDQKQHLELARDLAIRFNSTYSETFNVPEPYILKSGGRIMSLQTPTAKMSKSDSNALGTLYLFEEPESLQKKFRSAVTDSETEIRSAVNKPGISNLLAILSAATGKSIEALEKDYAGSSYSVFKNSVAEAVIEMLRPLRKRYTELMDDKTYLQTILQQGAENAQKRAYKMLSKVYRKTGFLERM
ncbi:MAG: tryptophan--tRNA ligase [Verrucomicrobia bacterium GWF2_51_19]|nr:MAG: tryptophan--tRNA ligase [Verrucomicrobia bacterium GWF2_51_19]HCJ12498.1 tryptophan--tRNA ligase [Opitutae bacterium]